MYFPEGIKAPDVIPRLLKKDVVVAGGLHKDHKRECRIAGVRDGDKPTLTIPFHSQVLPYRVSILD